MTAHTDGVEAPNPLSCGPACPQATCVTPTSVLSASHPEHSPSSLLPVLITPAALDTEPFLPTPLSDPRLCAVALPSHPHAPAGLQALSLPPHAWPATTKAWACAPASPVQLGPPSRPGSGWGRPAALPVSFAWHRPRHLHSAAVCNQQGSSSSALEGFLKTPAAAACHSPASAPSAGDTHLHPRAVASPEP